jgi:hypothetical protein
MFLNAINSGLWPLASGLRPLASGLWPLASGLWPLASGLWHLAQPSTVIGILVGFLTSDFSTSTEVDLLTLIYTKLAEVL